MAPAMAILGRSLRNRLDLLKGDVSLDEIQAPLFKVGDSLGSQLSYGSRWITGTVTKTKSNVMFEVITPKGSVVPHADQVRLRLLTQEVSHDSPALVRDVSTSLTPVKVSESETKATPIHSFSDVTSAIRIRSVGHFPGWAMCSHNG